MPFISETFSKNFAGLPIYERGETSDDFKSQIAEAFQIMRPAIRENFIATTPGIYIGRTLQEMFPDNEDENLQYSNGQFFYERNGIIGISEFLVNKKTGILQKKDDHPKRYKGDLLHESGHFFDLMILGGGTFPNYYSHDPKTGFFQAHATDVEMKLFHSTHIPDVVERNLNYFIENPREVFAELWAHEMGCSSMGQDIDIRPLWPNSLGIVQQAIQQHFFYKLEKTQQLTPEPAR